jgi:hypothetical protein
VTGADNVWRNDTAQAWATHTGGDLTARGNAQRGVANASSLLADASRASIAEHKAQWWQTETPNYLQWSIDIGTIETTYTDDTTDNILQRAMGVKNAGVKYATDVGKSIQDYDVATAAAREEYISKLMTIAKSIGDTLLDAERDKEIALADAELQKQLTGNESAYSSAVQAANDAYTNTTTSAEASRKSQEQTARSTMNTKLSDELKNKEADIAAAERLYDQVVASLDAQYGSASSNGDTGVERATRRSAIKTRDAQYYAARDTSWANTLSGSATIGNTPWTLKAIASANAQAAYSTNRARAQAAHDAALLSAMNDWRESSSAAYLKSLVSSSRAENDFKSSVAGFWADWNMATEGNDRGAPTGFLGSVTDSVMGLMNPFDTDSIARSLTTETKADTTNGPPGPKPSDTFLMQPFPLPMNSLFDRRRWEQQLTNDPAEANTNTVFIAMTGGGIGHHWVTMSKLLEHADEFEEDVLYVLIGSYSGPLTESHNRRSMGGHSHTEYDEAVAEFLVNYLETRTTKGKITAVEAQQIAQRLFDGSAFKSEGSKVLREFNEAVIKELRDQGDLIEPKDADVDDLIKQGTRLKYEPRIRKILRAGKVASIFMSVLGPLAKSAEAMDAINRSNALKMTFQHVENGDYGSATNNLVSYRATSLMSVIQEKQLVDSRLQPLPERRLREMISKMKAWEDDFYADR